MPWLMLPRAMRCCKDTDAPKMPLMPPLPRYAPCRYATMPLPLMLLDADADAADACRCRYALSMLRCAYRWRFAARFLMLMPLIAPACRARCHAASAAAKMICCRATLMMLLILLIIRDVYVDFRDFRALIRCCCCYDDAARPPLRLRATHLQRHDDAAAAAADAAS